MIGFYLMSKKGFAVLNAVMQNVKPAVISYVVSSRDEGVANDYYAEIKSCCGKHGVKFYDRKEKNNDNCKYKIAVSWRWLIAETANLVVLHDSLLPQYRGFNPLVTALINGDETIGVTALWANAEFDRGRIIYQSSAKITYPVKIAAAIDIISNCYTELVLKITNDLNEGVPLPSHPQEEAAASYSLWRDEEDYKIDWTLNAAVIKRMIDASGYPYKGACFVYNKKIIRVDEAEVAEDFFIVNRIPGKLIKLEADAAYVVCGSGILKLITMRHNGDHPFVFKKLRVRLV